MQLLQQFCRDHDQVFILDEVQANFGRTGDLFAYETYQLEPDLVVLGKSLGNGVPVAAVAALATGTAVNSLAAAAAPLSAVDPIFEAIKREQAAHEAYCATAAVQQRIK